MSGFQTTNLTTAGRVQYERNRIHERLKEKRAQKQEQKANDATPKALAAQANTVRQREILLERELKDFTATTQTTYADAMRRFNKFQSMAGLMNICLTMEYNRHPINILISDDADISQKSKDLMDSVPSNNARVIKNLDSHLASLQGQAIGDTATQKIQSIRENIITFTNNMLSPKSLSNFTHVKTEHRNSSDSSPTLCIRANPLSCQGVNDKEFKQLRDQLGSILKQSWTVLASMGHINGTGANSIPAVKQALDKAQAAVLQILTVSDDLLYEELEQIQSTRKNSEQT